MIKTKLSAILILLFSGFAASTYAQEDYAMFEDRTFYAGLILGGNFAQVDGDNFAGYKKTGLNAGGVVYIKMDYNLALSMEVLFAQKGSRSKIAQSLSPGQYVTRYGIDLNYAEVPVLINYFDRHKHNFGGGFSYSRLATANEYITVSPPPLTPYNPQQYPFKKGDLNLVFNGNLNVYKGLYFNLRFQYSLISIRAKVPTNYIKAAQYNNVWTVRLIYLFK